MAKLPEAKAVAAIGAVLDEDDAVWGPKVEGKCNAKITSGGRGKRRCKNDCGYGTDHEGYGPCKHHFGATPQVRRGTSRAMYEAEFAHTARFGEVREVDPMTGILTEIGRTNGFIAYLEERISQNVVDGKNEDVTVTYVDGNGNVHVEPLMILWRAERAHFARICKMAGDMGIAQAAIDLARVMGDRLADLLETVIRDLGMDPDSPEVDKVVRARLSLVGGTDVAKLVG